MTFTGVVGVPATLPAGTVVCVTAAVVPFAGTAAGVTAGAALFAFVGTVVAALFAFAGKVAGVTVAGVGVLFVGTVVGVLLFAGTGAGVALSLVAVL